MLSNGDVLNSWKEVASYMGRGVRTVQRWEQELNLPVRRPRGKSRSAVIAFKAELDLWLHQSQTDHAIVTSLPVEHQLIAASEKTVSLNATRLHRTRLHDRTVVLMEKMGQLVSRSNGLCERSKLLSEQLNQMVLLTTKYLELPPPRKASVVEGAE